MLARLCAFVIWALVSGVIVFWALRLLVSAPDAPAHTVPVGVATVTRGDLGRLLGSTPTATAAVVATPEAASRFKLIGVMAPKRGPRAEPSGQGVALIAVDGKPARAFAVGARLDDDLVLQSVSLRSASIGPPQGAAAVKLEIPPLPAPATGVLQPTSMGSPAIVPPTAVVSPPAPMPAPAMPAAVPPVMQPPGVAAPVPPGVAAARRDSQR